MCICFVCMSVCMYVCMSIYIYIYIHTIYIYIYIMYIYIYIVYGRVVAGALSALLLDHALRLDRGVPRCCLMCLFV